MPKNTDFGIQNGRQSAIFGRIWKFLKIDLPHYLVSVDPKFQSGTPCSFWETVARIVKMAKNTDFGIQNGRVGHLGRIWKKNLNLICPIT